MNNTASHLAYVIMEGIDIDIEVGVDPLEHGRIQRLVIDVEVGFEDQRTRIPDSQEGLTNGFDYSQVRDCITASTRTKTYLLETIANRIADAILKLEGAQTCSVKVGKRQCWPNIALTSVKIFRSRVS